MIHPGLGRDKYLSIGRCRPNHHPLPPPIVVVYHYRGCASAPRRRRQRAYECRYGNGTIDGNPDFPNPPPEPCCIIVAMAHGMQSPSVVLRPTAIPLSTRSKCPHCPASSCSGLSATRCCSETAAYSTPECGLGGSVPRPISTATLSHIQTPPSHLTHFHRTTRVPILTNAVSQSIVALPAFYWCVCVPFIDACASYPTTPCQH